MSMNKVVKVPKPARMNFYLGFQDFLMWWEMAMLERGTLKFKLIGKFVPQLYSCTVHPSPVKRLEKLPLYSVHGIAVRRICQLISTLGFPFNPKYRYRKVSKTSRGGGYLVFRGSTVHFHDLWGRCMRFLVFL